MREVWEETGFDLTQAGLVKPESEMKYIEVSMREQHMRLYVFRSVPEDAEFEPQTRKEISKIQWYRISDLPTQRKGQGVQETESNRFYMVAPFINQLKRWIKEQKQADKAKARSGTHMVHEYEPETAGELTAEEDFQQSVPIDEMTRLHALLARSGSAPVPAPIAATQPNDVDALKQLLGLEAPSTATNGTTLQDQRRNDLLSLFKGASAGTASMPQMQPQSNAGPPHTPFEQVIQQPVEARTPHHHHPRQHPVPQGPPPSFPYSPAHMAQAQHSMHAHPHPVPGQPPLGANGQYGTYGMAPPPSFGMPPHLMHQQQWTTSSATVLPGFQSNSHLISETNSTQTPPHPNVQGMAVPKATNLPKPKFNPQSHFRKRSTHQSTGYAHHPGAAVDNTDPFRRKLSLAPAQAATSQLATVKPLVSDAIQAAAANEQQKGDPPHPTQLMGEQQSTLLDLFNRSSAPHHPESADAFVIPAELPGDTTANVHHNSRALPQSARRPSQGPNEAQGKLLDLFKPGPSPHAASPSQPLVDPVQTPENRSGGEQYQGSPANKFLSARRSMSKGSSSLPQPVISILQRPVAASPRRNSPDVRPPSVPVPVHTVKNSTPMQAPKPFNPQILKRPAQLESAAKRGENAANAPIPVSVPDDNASQGKAVQLDKQHQSLLGLPNRPPQAGRPPQPTQSMAQGYNRNVNAHQQQQGITLSGGPAYPPHDASMSVPMRTQGTQQQNNLLGLFNNNKPSIEPEPWNPAPKPVAVSSMPLNNNLYNLLNNSTHHAVQPHLIQARPAEASAMPRSNPLLEPYKTSSPQMVVPPQPGSFGNEQFVDRRTSTGKEQKNTLLNLFNKQMPMVTTSPSSLSQLNTAIGEDIVSPLDPLTAAKSRMSSLNTLPADTRRGSEAVERRGSGLERRGSAGLQTPKTPQDRAFLLGFLDQVAKGGK